MPEAAEDQRGMRGVAAGASLEAEAEAAREGETDLAVLTKGASELEDLQEGEKLLSCNRGDLPNW